MAYMSFKLINKKVGSLKKVTYFFCMISNIADI